VTGQAGGLQPGSKKGEKNGVLIGPKEQKEKVKADGNQKGLTQKGKSLNPIEPAPNAIILKGGLPQKIG